LKRDIFKNTDWLRTLIWLGLGVQIDPVQINAIQSEVKNSIEKIYPSRKNLTRNRRISRIRMKKISESLKHII
jgi:hypothetical protein